MYAASFSRGLALGFATTLLIAAAASAQTGTSTSDTVPEHVTDLVVSASRSQKTQEQMAVHTTIITRAEVMSEPAQTLDQALRDVPGMNLPGAPYYTTDPTGHQTRMRGITNSTVLVLLDGIPIHDPFYVTTQWFKVPISSVDRVEVMRGGASSVWGNLAAAGVVNIVTRKPTDNTGELDVNYESYHTEVASLAKNFVAKDGVAFRISGDVLNTDGYQTTPGQYLAALPGKGASGANNYNLRFDGYYTPSSNVSAFFRAGYHRQDEDIGNYQFGDNLQESPDAAAGVTASLSLLTRLDVRAWGQWETFHKQNGAACFLASASSCNTTATSSPLVQYRNSQDYNPYREAGASAMISSALTGLSATIQGGLDFRRVAGEDTATTFNKPTGSDLSSSTINRVAYGQGAQVFLGGFTQFSFFPTSKLQSTVALRYDYWTNTDGIAELTPYAHGVPDSTVGGPIADSHKGQFDPSLTARYAFSGAVAVRGAVYRGFRAPGLNNLYRSYSSTTSITIANPNLEPQTLTGGEVGVDLQGKRVTFGVTGFQYSTQDLIASYKIQNAASAPADVILVCGPTLANCPANVNYNTNAQNAFSQGIEASFDWRASPAFAVDLGYAYTDSHYTSTTTSDPINVQLGAIPKHVATADLSWAPAARLLLRGTLRYSSSMYLDINQTIPQDAFALLGVNASYQVTPQVQLYAAGTNLTNVLYSDAATSSASSTTLGMGRAITGGFRWTF